MSLIQYLLTIIISFGILWFAGIRIMEMLKIKNVYGEFANNNDGTRFKLYAHIISNGFSATDIADIKVQIKGARNLYCFLEGDIKKDEENKNFIVTTEVLNYSNKSPKKLNFNITLAPNERHSKVHGCYLSTKHIFNEDSIKATLTIETNSNIFIKLLSFITPSKINEKKHDFQFKRVKEIKKPEGYNEIPLIEEKL